MAEPYLGEIRMFAGNYAPEGWAFCNGQQIQIATNDALYSLLGTTYGGDGQTYFNLPDLRGRVPLHVGNVGGTNFQLGSYSGAETVALTVDEMPSHYHQLNATQNGATTNAPKGNVLAPVPGSGVFAYGTDQPIGKVNPKAVSTVGKSKSHDNLQPFLCISFIIALAGQYPPQP